MTHGDEVASRANILQKKTQQSVQFEITEQTREVIAAWLQKAHLTANDYLFVSRQYNATHLSFAFLQNPNNFLFSKSFLHNVRILRGWRTLLGLKWLG